MTERSLNKIVLINSAGTKYLELELGGNIHLIGDQGAGKTTLLRAVLFFYNPHNRKEKLGIKPSQEPFSKFYFPYANSHIIYEVATEEGKFCVWVYAEAGQPVFYFIDSQYERDFWAPEGKKALLPAETKDLLRQNSIHISRKIFRLKDYRDVIYGKTNERKLKPFYLLKSQNYENIPNTVSNIFLNAQLNSQYIKRTIINSLFDIYEADQQNLEESLKINLDDIRSLLNDFKQAYDDIANFKYFKKTIERIIGIYQDALKIQNQIKLLATRIFTSYANYLDFLPQLEKNMTGYRQQLQQLKAELDRTLEQHRQKEDAILGTVKELEINLRKAKERQIFWYKEVKIEEVLQRINQLPLLKTKLQAIESALTTLKTNFESIEIKYKNLEQQAQNTYNQQVNIINKKINDQRTKLVEETEKIRQKYAERLTELTDEIDQQLEALDINLQELTNHLKAISQQIAQVQHKRFFEDKIQDLEQKITQLTQKQQLNEQEIKSRRQQVKQLTEQKETKLQAIENDFKHQWEKLTEKHKQLVRQKQELEQKLAGFDRSLYKYLEQQHPTWRQTIGKVVREEILFCTELSPELKAPQDKLFYGVQLDLSKIQAEQPSLDDYKEQLAQIKSDLESLTNGMKQKKDQFFNEQTKTKQQFDKKIADHNKAIKELENENIYINGTLLPNFRKKLDDLNKQADKMRKEQLNELYAKEDELKRQEKKLRDRHKELIDNKRQIRQQIKTQENQEINALKAEIDKEIVREQEQLKQLEQTLNTELQQINERRQNELNDKGADQEQITLLERQKTEIEEQINSIRNEKERYLARFMTDKSEYLENIPQWENQLKEKQEVLEQIKTEHQNIQRQKQAKIDETKQKIDELNKQINGTKTAINRYEQFRQSTVFAKYQHFFVKDEQVSTDEPLILLIDRIKDQDALLDDTNYKLQQKINLFATNLRKDNVFHWKTREQLQTLEDYYVFARELKLYLDENRIAVSEQSMYERYSYIITNFAKAISALDEKLKDIKSVVSDINKDFKTSNFVRAIDDFQMTVKDSDNTVVNVLRGINRFVRENPYRTDEINLFSANKFEENKNESIRLLRSLMDALNQNKNIRTISLEDVFELEFRVKQNGIEQKASRNLQDVGSQGTDILLKAMIYIMLLNQFKLRATKKHKDIPFKLHCIMDEIGRLHTKNIKSLISFANDRDIWMIFGSPNPDENISVYHAIYRLEKKKYGEKPLTEVTKIIYK